VHIRQSYTQPALVARQLVLSIYLECLRCWKHIVFSLVLGDLVFLLVDPLIPSVARFLYEEEIFFLINRRIFWTDPVCSWDACNCEGIE